MALPYFQTKTVKPALTDAQKARRRTIRIWLIGLALYAGWCGLMYAAFIAHQRCKETGRQCAKTGVRLG